MTNCEGSVFPYGERCIGDACAACGEPLAPDFKAMILDEETETCRYYCVACGAERCPSILGIDPRLVVGSLAMLTGTGFSGVGGDLLAGWARDQMYRRSLEYGRQAAAAKRFRRKAHEWLTRRKKTGSPES